MVNRDILFRFLGDSRDLERASKKAASAMSPVRESAEKTTKKLDGISRALNVAMGAAAVKVIGDFAGAAITAASDLEEAGNAVEVVFGDASGVIQDFAKDSATAIGVSASDFMGLSATMGALLQNLGLDADTAADEVITLSERAADMASVFNTDVTEAIDAISSLLRGESDPIEKYGVKVNEASKKAFALAEGLWDGVGAMDDNTKALATLGLLYEQTDGIAGDFQNTSDSLAGQQRILEATFEDVKAKIGAALIPAVTDLMTSFNNLLQSEPFAKILDSFSDFSSNFEIGILKIKDKMEETFTLGLSELAEKVGLGKNEDFEIGFLSALRNIKNEVDEGTIPAVQAAAQAINHLGKEGQVSDRRLNKIRDTLGLTEDDMADATGIVLKYADANGISADAVQVLSRNLKRSEDPIVRQARAAGEAKKAQEDLEQANRDTGEALLDLAEKQKEHIRLTNNMRTINTRSKDRVLDHKNAIGDLEQELRDAADAQENLYDVLREGTDPVFAANRALKRHKAVLEEIGSKDSPGGAGYTADEILELWEAEMELKSAFTDLAAEEGVTKAIDSFATALGISRDKVKEVLKQLGILDEHGDITIDVKLRVSTGTITVGGETIPVYVTPGGKVVLHEGGIVPGPRGQEVAALLQAGERVISLKDQEQAERAARNGSGVMPFSPGGSAIHFNFAGPVVGGPQLVQEIREKMVLAQRRGATVAKV